MRASPAPRAQGLVRTQHHHCGPKRPQFAPSLPPQQALSLVPKSLLPRQHQALPLVLKSLLPRRQRGLSLVLTSHLPRQHQALSLVLKSLPPAATGAVLGSESRPFSPAAPGAVLSIESPAMKAAQSTKTTTGARARQW